MCLEKLFESMIFFGNVLAVSSALIVELLQT